jgi:hypothetical protein
MVDIDVDVGTDRDVVGAGPGIVVVGAGIVALQNGEVDLC